MKYILPLDEFSRYLIFIVYEIQLIIYIYIIELSTLWLPMYLKPKAEY